MTGGVAVQFSQGRSDGWEVGPLLGSLCRCLGIGREDVGNIKLRDSSATVELSQRGAEMLEARKERLARDGLVAASVRPASGERRDSARGDRKPQRGERSFFRERERDREFRHGKQREREREAQRGVRKRFAKKD